MTLEKIDKFCINIPINDFSSIPVFCDEIRLDGYDLNLFSNSSFVSSFNTLDYDLVFVTIIVSHAVFKLIKIPRNLSRQRITKSIS